MDICDPRRETAMRIPTAALLILCTAVFSATAAGGGSAEEAKPFDFKPLLPPVLPPLPPKSSVTSGAVGGAETPYTTAPLQNPTQRPSDPAPGIRLSIPSR
jgi:hypothetical protein